MIPGQQILDQVIPSRADLDLLGIPAGPSIVGLFAGYGGLEAGIMAAIGGTVVAYSEIEASSIKLLQAAHPGIPNLGDITKIDWSDWVGRIDVMCGGFPCQDVSHAGLGKGLRTGTRSGLWSEFARGIYETCPKLVVIENVKGLRSAPAGMKEEVTDEEEIELRTLSDVYAAARGETDRDLLGDDGHLGFASWGDRPVLRALGAVLGDLAELGYLATWASVRAADVGAPHGRERVFIVAVPDAA